MSYYRSDRTITPISSRITSLFIDGRYTVKENGITTEKELKPGCSSLNIELLRYSKDISRTYNHLITLESAFAAILKEYCPGRTVASINIWKLISAQKGTTNAMALLQRSLKKYKIPSEYVYKQIKADLDNTFERSQRNASFLNITADDAGLGKIAEIIKDQYGLTFTQYAETIAEKWLEENQDQVFAPEEKHDFFAMLNDHMIKTIQKIADENDIDLEHEIHDAENKQKAIVSEKQAKIRNERLADKRVILERAFEQEANLANDNMYKAFLDGNSTGYLSAQLYANMVHCMSLYRGRMYYVTCMLGKRTMYLSESGRCYYNMASIKFWPDKDNPELKTALDHLLQTHPNCAYKIMEFSVASEQSDRSMVVNKNDAQILMQDAMRRFESTLDDDTMINPQAVMYIEQFMMIHDSDAYYVGIIENKRALYLKELDHNRIRFLSDGTLSCVSGAVTAIYQQVKLFDNAEKAEYAAETLSNWLLPIAKHKTMIYTGKLAHRPGTKTEMILKQRISDVAVKFCNSLHEPFLESSHEHFRSEWAKNCFNSTLDSCGKAYMLTKCNLSPSSLIYKLSIGCVSMPNHHDLSIQCGCADTKVPDKVRFGTLISVPLYAVTKAGLINLCRTANNLNAKGTQEYCRVIEISRKNDTTDFRILTAKEMQEMINHENNKDTDADNDNCNAALALTAEEIHD